MKNLNLIEKDALIGAIDRMRLEYMEGSEVDKAFRTLEMAITLIPPVNIEFPEESDFDIRESILNDM